MPEHKKAILRLLIDTQVYENTVLHPYAVIPYNTSTNHEFNKDNVEVLAVDCNTKKIVKKGILDYHNGVAFSIEGEQYSSITNIYECLKLVGIIYTTLKVQDGDEVILDKGRWVLQKPKKMLIVGDEVLIQSEGLKLATGQKLNSLIHYKGTIKEIEYVDKEFDSWDWKDIFTIQTSQKIHLTGERTNSTKVFKIPRQYIDVPVVVEYDLICPCCGR